MEAAVELGATAINHIADNHGERLYDHISGRKYRNRNRNRNRNSSQQESESEDDQPPSPQPRQSQVSSARPRRYRAELPSPERETATIRDRELDIQSQTSDRILREYEGERDDPKRRPTASSISGRRPWKSDRMSHANGYASKSRYNDEDDDESDYDERTGQRYRSSGRGYQDRDRDYDREIVETERYRGPARDHVGRYDPNAAQAYASGPYQSGGAGGAVAPYRRSQGELTTGYGNENSRSSRSRGRRDDRYGEDSRERSRSHSGIRGKLEESFDTSMQGAAAGIAGALVGGLAARKFGDRKTQTRDMIIGALVGGLGANAAENKFKEYQDERREQPGRREERYDSGGRSRSRGR